MTKPMRREEVEAARRALSLVEPLAPVVAPRNDPNVLPDADALAEQQHDAALERLSQDKSGYARFAHVPSVDVMTGAMAPEEVVMVGGDIGDGKSLFGQCVFDSTTDVQKIPSLYIGTEQSDYVLKIKHCCIRRGISPKLVLKPTAEELNSLMYEEAMCSLEEELNWLHSAEMRELAFYANTDYVNRAELTKWISGGVKKYGIRFVVVDHVDQVNHGDGSNAVSELTETIQMLHGLAREHQMPILVLSQLKRRIDPIRRHSPPETSDFAGASGKERIAAIMLGIWRPLRTDLTIEELRDLKRKAHEGGIGADRIYEKDTMGVRLLKDRLGTVPGRQVMLTVGKGGRLSDDPALTHGIRTGGPLA